MSASLEKWGFGVKAHLQLELFPHSVLLVSLDDDVEIVEIFNDEVIPLVHRQKNLLDGGITCTNAAFSFRGTILYTNGGTYQVRRTPKFRGFSTSTERRKDGDDSLTLDGSHLIPWLSLLHSACGLARGDTGPSI